MITNKKFNELMNKFNEKAQYFYNQAEITIRMMSTEVKVAGGDQSDVENFQIKARDLLATLFNKYRKKSMSFNEISDTSLRGDSVERAQDHGQ